MCSDIISPEITSFFDEATNTVSYVVADKNSKKCAVIDSVLDFDYRSGRTSTQSADRIIEFIAAANYENQWILETHAHADHLSASAYLKEHLGGSTAIGAHIIDVQRTFSKIFNFELDYRSDGSQYDYLFDDHESFHIGALEVRIMHTPGHTPACLTYLVGDAAFIGDTLFMPDYGTARVDFPGGDAATLYHSIQKIFALPDETRLFMCHDYKAPERDEYLWETTVSEQKSKNVHVHVGIREADFIEMRNARDATLAMPALILPAIQINIRAGGFPPAEENGVSYLKLPLNTL